MRCMFKIPATLPLFSTFFHAHFRYRTPHPIRAISTFTVVTNNSTSLRPPPRCFLPHPIAPRTPRPAPRASKADDSVWKIGRDARGGEERGERRMKECEYLTSTAHTHTAPFCRCRSYMHPPSHFPKHLTNIITLTVLPLRLFFIPSLLANIYLYIKHESSSSNIQ